ncbi:MAG: glycogen synthase [Woeseiaceae bacterium]
MSRAPVIMVASENGALPGGKAGGVGDVIRELPQALATLDQSVTVICPSYGKLHTTEGMQRDQSFEVPFGPKLITIDSYVKIDTRGVRHIVLDHALFNPNNDQQIYNDDGSDRPFATDAGKFALLSAAAATWIAENAAEDAIIHLHDWHAAPALVLRALEPRLAKLRSHRTVLTLHNLSLQGIRPLDHDASSFAAWFPDLDRTNAVLIDPRYRDCFNPISAGIKLADAINTVSPTNAREILQPDDASRAFRGGEGLEDILRNAADEDRVHGILNGCDYDQEIARTDWSTLSRETETAIDQWLESDRSNRSLHELAKRRLDGFNQTPPTMLLTSVGRITDQKVKLLLHKNADGKSALSRLLKQLPDNAAFILLGTGDRQMEADFAAHSREHSSFLFLRGFSEPLSEALYSSGHLFVMPSSFEPCGISQMMSMRAGQPCLVHAVGGLNDTVVDGETGYRFAGDSLDDQVDAMLDRAKTAIAQFYDDKTQWQALSAHCRAQRFVWRDAAIQYQQKMYAADD